MKLTKYADYSREDVHDIFSPDSRFTPQAGTWGLHGIVPIPNRNGDYVFFVTYGKAQGDHVFDEWITSEGVLAWQSQPSNSLDSQRIIDLINHDEQINSIYLFLRTNQYNEYTYLGKLKYLTHDNSREKPVYFQWQILDWDITEGQCLRIGLKLHKDVSSSSGVIPSSSKKLIKTSVPNVSIREGRPTYTFRTIRNFDSSQVEKRNREIGLLGEKLVLQYETENLKDKGREDLALRVRHISIEEGDGAGYDILSFTESGEEKYIEVKTTTGTAESDFFITRNEVEFSNSHPNQFYLYRVYSLNETNETGSFFVIKGRIDESFVLSPTEYQVKLKPN